MKELGELARLRTGGRCSGLLKPRGQPLAAQDCTTDFQGYVGDIRTLERMRDAFRLGAYDQVVELAGTITLPDKMTETQRRMVEIAKAKIK